jgi:hypothetical protein
LNLINKPIDKEKLETLGLIVSYAGKKVLSNGGVDTSGLLIHADQKDIRNLNG